MAALQCQSDEGAVTDRRTRPAAGFQVLQVLQTEAVHHCPQYEGTCGLNVGLVCPE